MGGKRSKAAGKTGERRVKRYLESQGWLIADQETQGLAGDDLFARDPAGEWWSIEVKNVDCFTTKKYYQQARTQAQERVKAPLTALAKAVGVEYPKPNFLIVWTPTGCDNGKDFFVIRRKGGKTTFEVWELDD